MKYFLPIISLLLLSGCGLLKKEKDVPKLVRKPYLQSAIADSITVLWRTANGRECKVAYKEKGASNWMIPTRHCSFYQHTSSGERSLFKWIKTQHYL